MFVKELHGYAQNKTCRVSCVFLATMMTNTVYSITILL